MGPWPMLPALHPVKITSARVVRRAWEHVRYDTSTEDARDIAGRRWGEKTLASTDYFNLLYSVYILIIQSGAVSGQLYPWPHPRHSSLPSLDGWPAPVNIHTGYWT